MTPEQMEIYPVVIIGAGPAGIAAAMQLKRQGIDPLVLERDHVGGLLLNANWVENYPGFVKGISGPDLVELFVKQSERLGVRIEKEEVLAVVFQDKKFRIVTDKREFQAQYLVAASGTAPKKLPDNLISADVVENIYYQVYPLIGHKNKDLIIIGAGDAAFDYALNLSRRNRVTILNRGSEIKALGLLVDRVQKDPGISYQSQTAVSRIFRNNKGRLTVAAQKEGLEFECDYLLAAIGREPEYSFADPSIINEMETLLKDQKLFLIGDLQNGSFRQTTIAVADGIRTAMLIGQILEKG